MLGDGSCLNAVGRGLVALMMKLPDGKKRKCDTLFVPDFSYNLLSVSKVFKARKVTEFDRSGCQVVGSNKKLIACGSRCGSLYILECESCDHATVALAKEDVWHRQYGHLGAQGLRKLAVEGLVEGFVYDGSKNVSFCESCTEGKQHFSF